MNRKLDELRLRLREVGDLRAAAAVLHWDQTTYMPPKGAAARGRHIATLERLAHTAFTDAAVGALLDDLQPYADRLPRRASRRRVDPRHSAATTTATCTSRPTSPLPSRSMPRLRMPSG